MLKNPTLCNLPDLLVRIRDNAKTRVKKNIKNAKDASSINYEEIAYKVLFTLKDDQICLENLLVGRSLEHVIGQIIQLGIYLHFEKENDQQSMMIAKNMDMSKMESAVRAELNKWSMTPNRDPGSNIG